MRWVMDLYLKGGLRPPFIKQLNLGIGFLKDNGLVMAIGLVMGNGLVFEAGPSAPLYLITKFGYWTFNG